MNDPTPVGGSDPLLMGQIFFGPLKMPARFEPLVPRPICELDYSLNRMAQKQQTEKQRLTNKFLKFIPDANAARGRSKDRSTKVGAVVIDEDFNVRISGYNGFARGVDDEVDARHERPTKYMWAAHAEENCVAQAARVGVSLRGCTILLTSLFPCTTCSRLIIQSGIKRILAPAIVDNTRWDEQAKTSNEMLAEAGVEVIYYGEKE